MYMQLWNRKRRGIAVLMLLGKIWLLLLPALAGAFSLPLGARDALMQVRLSSMDRAAVGAWLMKRSFAAVLPIQPMLVKPLEEPLCGMELTFRRKPNSEKGGVDGGMRFTVSKDDEGNEGDGVMLVSRISEGQYTSKIFSEIRILKKFVSDLDGLPSECGQVVSVVNLQENNFSGGAS